MLLLGVYSPTGEDFWKVLTSLVSANLTLFSPFGRTDGFCGATVGGELVLRGVGVSVGDLATGDGVSARFGDAGVGELGSVAKCLATALVFFIGSFLTAFLAFDNTATFDMNDGDAPSFDGLSDLRRDCGDDVVGVSRLRNRGLRCLVGDFPPSESEDDDSGESSRVFNPGEMGDILGDCALAGRLIGKFSFRA